MPSTLGACEDLPVVTRCYALNASLLIAHEIDSAYWHEWEMFGMPGGNGLFVVLHVALAWLVLIAYGEVVRGRRSARLFSALLAGVGILTVAIHVLFLAAGRPEFRSPVSIGLLTGIAVVSVAQLTLAARPSRKRTGA